MTEPSLVAAIWNTISLAVTRQAISLVIAISVHFLSFDTWSYPKDLGTGQRIAVRAGDSAWTVTLTPERAAFTRSAADGADAMIDGPPSDVLLALWHEMEQAFAASLAAAKLGLQAFLTTLNRAWNLVGRVHFNLAENRRDPDQPFAFMATYTTRLSAQAKVQHVPLGQALREYAGAANRDKLLSLLLPVQRAAEHCVWLKPMIDAGDIFHPLRWGPTEASRFLQSVPELESAGVVVRMPVSWRASRPARPQVTATVGSRAPLAVGLDGLLDFQMGVMLDGEPLTSRPTLGGECSGITRFQQLGPDRLGRRGRQPRRGVATLRIQTKGGRKFRPDAAGL